MLQKGEQERPVLSEDVKGAGYEIEGMNQLWENWKYYYEQVRESLESLEEDAQSSNASKNTLRNAALYVKERMAEAENLLAIYLGVGKLSDDPVFYQLYEEASRMQEDDRLRTRVEQIFDMLAKKK